jgi:hypothetical protein
MRHNYLFALLSCFLILVSCNKEEHAPEPEVDINKYLDGGIIKNITLNSVEFEYKLPYASTETGAFISSDSSKLISSKIEGTYTAAVFDQQQNHYSILVESLKPYTKYWYTIKVKKPDGTSEYSKLLSFETSGFNLRWQDGFTNSVKLENGTYDPLVLEGYNLDTDLLQYSVELGDLPIYYIFKIEKVEDNSSKHNLQILIPWNISVGKKKFSLHYKGKKIFEDEILVEQGNTFDAVKVSEQPQLSGADWVYFKYKEKVHIIPIGSNKQLSIWDPTTNQWESKPVPDAIEMRRKMKGTEVNGKIYFPPFAKVSVRADDWAGAPPRYQEIINSYDPANDSWKSDVLYIGGSSNDLLSTEDMFALNGKLYAIVVQHRYDITGNSERKDLLKVFDPTDKSWQEVMQLNIPNLWGYKTIVVQNEIFIVTAEMRSQSSATTYFTNVVYKLDFGSKSITKRAELKIGDTGRGNWGAAVFEYKGQIYLYGGEAGVGYFRAPSTDLYRYDISSDKWTWLRPLAVNLPSFDHFAYNLNGKVYTGFGYRTSYERGKDIYELKLLDF